MNPPAPATPVRRWAVPAGAVLLVAAVCAVYANSLGGPFLFDDGPAILRNETIRSLWPLAGPLNPPLNGAGVTGRPLVNLSLAINYALGGLDVRGYHAMNTGLHALAALALWGVLRRTLRRQPAPAANAEALAAVTALLWAVHPLLTESVAGVVQRSEILGGLFYLLTLYGFIRSVGDGARARGWQAVAVAACLLGIASKEIVATAPLIVLLYDRTFVAGTFAAAWQRRKGFYLALAGTWLPLAWLVAGNNQRDGIVGFGLGMSSWDYLLTQCRALTTYLSLSVWPHPLIIDYGTGVSRVGEVWRQGLLILALLAGTGWALGRRPVWGFVGAWFFVMLAPSSSFVPLTTQTIAEHRMYLPLVAVVIAAVVLLHRLAGRRAVPIALLLAAGLAATTIRRNRDYQSEQGLWTELIARQPDNARAHASLAYSLAKQERWDEAAAHYAEAVRLVPGYADARNDLGNVLARLGRPAEALAQLGTAHGLKPDDPVINCNYGAALVATGRPAEALARFEAALRARPGLTEARLGLGRALAALNRLPEAVAQYRDGLRRDGGSAALHANLADALFDLGQLPEAAAEYARALKSQPDFVSVRHNLALTLVRLGRPAEAIPHYEEVLRQLPGSAQAHHNFALALEQAGRVADAAAQDEAALRIDPELAAARRHLARLRGR
jgi:tetratricopeptide (TPR) repeat protein